MFSCICNSDDPINNICCFSSKQATLKSESTNCSANMMFREIMPVATLMNHCMIKSFPKKIILYQTNGEMTKDEKNEVAGPRLVL